MSAEELAVARAWHDASLRWLSTLPGYRELLRERVAEAARKAERDLDRTYRRDRDLIGRSVDGCG